MRFIDVFPAFLEGKKIKIKGHADSDFLQKETHSHLQISIDDVLSGLWEIVDEPKKPRKFRLVRHKENPDFWLAHAFADNVNIPLSDIGIYEGITVQEVLPDV